MSLTREEVDHIATLAHLTLSEAQKARYQEQLSAILDYAARIQAVDTSAISPTATVLPLRTILRDDSTTPSLSREAALTNAPEAIEGCFAVPPLR